MQNMTRRTDSTDFQPTDVELWLAEDRRRLDLGPAARGTYDPALWPDPDVWTAKHDEPVDYWPVSA
jgi:hypothetical protein